VGRKLASALIDGEPLVEINALAGDCLRQLIGVPHVVVRINDGIYEQARDRLEALAQAQGFSGRLVILAAPEIPPGDCRIEWADGGVVRDSAAIEAAIADAVERYVASRLAGARPARKA
jgi:flagellar assembly protein FliH